MKKLTVRKCVSGSNRTFDVLLDGVWQARVIYTNRPETIAIARGSMTTEQRKALPDLINGRYPSVEVE